MEDIYSRIWELALPYRDKRNDVGHTQIATDFAIRLLETEDGDCGVVIPAIILHDIGWSQLDDIERKIIFSNEISKEDERRLRLKHQDEGVRLARGILASIGYGEKNTAEILEIISQHDTRNGFFSKNDGLVCDADKLWMYSARGFKLDIERRQDYLSPMDWYNQLDEKIKSDSVFYSDKSREIARSELDKRFAEM